MSKEQAYPKGVRVVGMLPLLIPIGVLGWYMLYTGGIWFFAAIIALIVYGEAMMWEMRRRDTFMKEYSHRLAENKAAVKRAAWSCLLSENSGDVIEAVERMLREAHLPEPLQDSEGCWLLPWPIDPKHPEGEEQKYLEEKERQR